MRRVIDGGLVPAVLYWEITTHYVVGEHAQAPEVSSSSVSEGEMYLGGHVDHGAASGHALVIGRFDLKDMGSLMYDRN